MMIATLLLSLCWAVEVTWGSALTGHWGFQVAPDGEVKDLEPGRGTTLRVSRDIQFVSYGD